MTTYDEHNDDSGDDYGGSWNEMWFLANGRRCWTTEVNYRMKVLLIVETEVLYSNRVADYDGDGRHKMRLATIQAVYAHNKRKEVLWQGTPQCSRV